MKINKIKKITDHEWINLFNINLQNKNGDNVNWMMASRKQDVLGQTDIADAVVIVPFLNDKMVLIKQYRPPTKDYIIEHPAGLIDNGETIDKAAIRELREETGLNVDEVLKFNDIIYNSPGFTDESVSYVFVKASGKPTVVNNESSENIEILILDRKEVKNLLMSDMKFSAKCWLMSLAYVQGFNWFDEVKNLKSENYII
jgi:ADP-ribose pyrophosphatase